MEYTTRPYEFSIHYSVHAPRPHTFYLMPIREEEILIWSACCFGNKICTSSNTDGSRAGIEDEHDQPGMFISIIQIESPQGVLMPVIKGKKNRRKYHVATIFVAHFSKLTYVHFSESTKANKAVEAKHALEPYSAAFGVKIQKYHADNVAFNTRIFRYRDENRSEERHGILIP